MTTEGGNLRIYNNTPYNWTLVDQHSYQVEWGTHGSFPTSIPAKSSCGTHIEWSVFWVVESDDGAHATYRVDTGSSCYFISFRGDKDTGKFNIWVDLHKQIGNIPMDPSTTTVSNVGWSHDGTVSFSLYYNDEKRLFTVSPLNPVVYTGKMEVGYYSLDIGIFEHTYCIMKQDDQTNKVNFHCSGGINGTGNVFPAYFYDQNAEKKGKEAPCNPLVARVLAAWDENVEWTRTDYNRSTDYAGIHYGIDGVCHQICNTILCSTNTEHPFSGYVNWPDSFDISRFFYAIRGNASRRDTAIQKLVDVAKNLTIIDDSKRALFPILAEIRSIARQDLESYLSGESLQANRVALIRQNIMSANNKLTKEEVEAAASKIVDLDMKLAKDKVTLDNQLMNDSIKKEQYANEVNSRLIKLNNGYSELSLNSSIKPIGDKQSLHVVNPNFIPDYREVKSRLGMK
ncbi:MAG: hypothetical protein LBT32_03090 [Peptococcaceae bacterium]|jgi:hypothetical protein|nr:hypothetical protein [Peptococcaceae bacterium]